MTVSIARLCSSYVAASATALYTVDANARTRIDAMTAVNTDTSTRTLSVYLVASGGSPSGSNIVLQDYSIAPGASYLVLPAIGHTLQSGGKIYAVASVANKIALYASGVEVT